MAMIVTPRLLRRGLEVFAGISVLGFVGLLFYGNNLALFLQAMLSLKWGWALLGVGLASLDWVGGGLRLWIITRHVYPRVTLPGAVVAGGLNTWGGFLTPTQTGGGPLMIYALKRYGVPLPEAMISSLMTFVATVVFFAVAGPVALLLGAGRSLEQHGILGRAFTLYDLFRLSLGGFIAIGLLMIALFVFPEVARRIGQRLVSWLERHGSPRLAGRVNELREGVDRSHGCLVAFFRGKGWTALAAAVVLSSLAFGNRLAAGYVVLRALDIHAHFVDVILLQTLITFLLYFAPTPGGSGLAEVLSAAVMSIYVPRVLTPSYILLWRVITCYLTVAFGSFVFWRWLKGAEVRVDGNQLENGHIAPPPRAD
ncbi:MAG: flippase-like domain-containing protein [Gemmatimonadetes bacterium]|nr:flippase-like domain-containing protein [Gemmatimonadota bacterium]MBI2403517.1 flippase-like domain-containing protein [Gemmatimonadota bacterium]